MGLLTIPSITINGWYNYKSSQRVGIMALVCPQKKYTKITQSHPMSFSLFPADSQLISALSDS